MEAGSHKITEAWVESPNCNPHWQGSEVGQAEQRFGQAMAGR